ncbi:MAG TPA: zinc-ribbon and DUF3426 domain-containing protein [Methylococcales bacterium]
MFTQCTECQTIQPLTLAQLRAGRGMLCCSHCSVLFDALERISETEEINPSDNLSSRRLPWDKENKPGNANWRIGLVIGSLVLIGQIIYFEGYALSQNPAVRPGLVKLCRMINCQLPVYRNLDELSILHGSFTPLPDQNYAFRMVMSNQAAFAQTYPNIKLTLLDYSGNTFAHRFFKPRDYLPVDAVASLMTADETIEISLKIAAPETKVSGSTFDLIY